MASPAQADEREGADRALPPPLAAGPQLTDRAALGLALAVAAAAWWHHPIPTPVVGAALVVAAAVRRPVVVILATALLASWLAARSYAGLRPAEPRAFHGTVTLVSDPSPTPYGWKADVRVDGHRVELAASGGAGGSVSRSLAGERLAVRGRVVPPPPRAPWLIPRHVIGRLQAREVDRAPGGGAAWRAANRVRRLLQTGSTPMPEPARSLYAGFVLGDDRDQPPEIIDDFRGAGLSHLLVVSGQNVAFVLVLASPLLRHLTWRGRWLLTVAVIGSFGAVTRFEPSVLRAAAMAAVAVTAGAVGRPAGAVRTLALAVAGIVLVDPLLVRSVGFQLSVGASLAIAVLARPIAALVPGPRPIADALGVTLAAQVGVAPVLIPLTGGLPVASLVANPLAVPVAGIITTWGLPAGLVAGAFGGTVALVVHAPTRLMIAWVAGVARIGAALPLGALGWGHLAALAVAGALARHAGTRRTAALVVAGAAVVAPSLALARAPASQRFDHGVEVRRGGGATVVLAIGGPQPIDVLADLRRAGVRQVDVLVVDGRAGAQIERAVRHRWHVGRALDAHDGPATRLRVGSLVVTSGGGVAPEVAAAPPEPTSRVGR